MWFQPEQLVSHIATSEQLPLHNSKEYESLHNRDLFMKPRPLDTLHVDQSPHSLQFTILENIKLN